MSIVQLFTTMLCFLSCLQYATASNEETVSLATKLANNYLKSFPEEVKPLSKRDSSKKQSLPNILDIDLSPRTKREVIFNTIFPESKYYQEQYQEKDNLLNQYVWNDLALFCGTPRTPNYHLLSRINRTITMLGEGALASLIGAPIVNLEELDKRQKLIGFFCQQNTVSNDLKKILHNYQPSEKIFLSFWTKTDPLYTKEYDKYLTKLFYINNPASKTNKSAGKLQLRKLLCRDIWDIYTKYVPLSDIMVREIMTMFTSTTHHELYSSRSDYLPLVPIFGPVFDWLYTTATYATISSISKVYDYWRGYQKYKEYAHVLRNLALRMSDVKTFLLTVQKVNTLIQENPALEELYDTKLTAIRRLLASANEPSEIGNLVRYLKALPLQSWSYLWSNAGKLLASYKLFVANKAAFHDAMYELGQLDAFLSIATLMEETRAIGAPHCYTFTKLLAPKQYKKPCFIVSEMWNIMLEPMAAVGNDVTMGEQSATQHIVLTGPNAGGKSTFLRGIAQTVLLSQTFGIAPAKFCEMTPFNKINTYIEVTDDIVAGKSLFLAEVDRFEDHLNLLKQLKQEMFSFSIFDEPFSGTNPKEGNAATYAVVSYIAKYSNTLNIIATHYPDIVLLETREQKNGFKNYKVFIKTKKDTNIAYTYKIVPGISNQTIAIDILEKQNWAADILKKARYMYMVENPK